MHSDLMICTYSLIHPCLGSSTKHQTPAPIMQKRHSNLMAKLDSNAELMTQKFQNILDLSSILDKSQGTLAIETLQIEADSSTIIRLTEELLSISRTLKESWILGQLPQIEVDKVQEGLYDKMNLLLDSITYGDVSKNSSQEATEKTDNGNVQDSEHTREARPEDEAVADAEISEADFEDVMMN
ncbi:unnamed protein product [Kuraishia capsulata CBS 1993]|uniref:Mediator of RNA polymerase II transcription subunit 22 n=1 Tax=Kuraishia capsulata CBS 1993 TaxID=1382522 RepID=W6MR81_9ASCO|nr:uncharacterized protein KUCA_T00003736001 [Kuraishia capsulata CBS 1993]CDK27757.1 unnamed protein product [Kuraishia capsulata CBS 1993]